jgi:hypothetical protein
VQQRRCEDLFRSTEAGHSQKLNVSKLSEAAAGDGS